ncbi:MAG: hypothetical protein LUQ18_09605, partial [Methylococcaceae bacterium]|nr:hypothetical protein [Methylococcaceae bacterium]
SVHAVDSSGGLTFTSGTTHAIFNTTTDDLIRSPVSNLAVTLDTAVTLVLAPPPVLTTPLTVNYTDTAVVDTFVTIIGTLEATGTTDLTYGITDGSDNGTTVTKANAYGTLVVTKATGGYTFTPNSATIEPLKANGIDTDNAIQVTVSDTFSQTASQAFTVTITQSGSTESTGDDSLLGTAGVDHWAGLAGNDTYSVNNTADTIVENVNEGTDTVNSTLSYTLSANIENLILTGSVAINGTGNALNNQLTGNSADNILGGGAGVDTMIGGVGNDTYGVDNSSDVVVENAGEGTDIVSSVAASYTLAANVENLRLAGTAAINGTGNGLNNQITGNSANNVLDGLAGADTMLGGVGDDSYTVDNTGDVVTENAGEGSDTVNSIISYTLTTDVENLFLTGNAVINGTGNALNNQLTGNSADNVLGGGAGVDTMTGGLGNDTYGVNDTNDVVVENAGEGTDTVSSVAASYTLAANVENLRLAGTAAINGTGNTLNNQLTGNSADNVLGGGAGVDTMIGGLGNDTYGVDNSSDVVVENAGEGTDTVSSVAASYTLAANVENLRLAGTAAINGTGNAQDNQLTGNSANNTLTGGEGADILIGGLGKDTYNLTETTAATDTLSIATGDSLVSSYDVANNFKLGTGSSPTSVGVDRLDLSNVLIAANGTGDGVDIGAGANAISSHSITNGIISFDSLGVYDTPVAVTAATNLANVLSYVEANITGGNTVAFVSEGNTFVFQDGGVTDTLVELVGVTAQSVSTTGSVAGSVWIA